VGRLAGVDKLPLGLRLTVGRLGSRIVPPRRRGGRLLRELSVPPERRRLHLSQEAERELETTVLSRAFVDFLREGEADSEWETMLVRPSSVTNDQLVDQDTYLPDDILVKVDRCSMAVSLEARVPLLDHVLAEFVNSLPSSFKLRDGRAKNILKDVMSPYVPAAILERPKKGFAIPLRAWLTGPLRSFVEETLCASDSGPFDRVGVGALLASLDGDGPDRSKLVWLLLSLGVWAQAQPGRPF
jgi:asparagine synthetase B (glutamine-hydrolysing)